MTADELTWDDQPSLRSPIMVVALEGLFDAAEAATSSVRHLGRKHGSERFASIDGDGFFDFTQRRPTAVVDRETKQRQILWPENDFFAATVDDHDRDLILIHGVEPHLRWRTFCDLISTVAEDCGASMVVTLGAMVGMAPHTRPLGVVGSATDPALATQLGLSSPSYQGPTGVIGALHDQLNQIEMPVVSLRVSVPHYVPGPPNPEAARSLLQRFELVTGVKTEHQELAEMASDWRKRVDTAVESDPEMQEYVANLEAQVDQQAEDLLPSGDDLAGQLEAFLRNRESDPES